MMHLNVPSGALRVWVFQKHGQILQQSEGHRETPLRPFADA